MFSVVIPLYNKELSIQNTIHSVLNQTVQDFEIVIVNDGSTDNSVEKVVEIIDARIRIINKPNGGVSSARNMGVEEAKYEWIAFLDGDDLWKVNHLEEIVKMMKLFPSDKVFVNSFEYSDKRLFFRHPRETENFVIDNYFREALKEPLIWTSIVVVNKECFLTAGYFNTDLSRGEDLDLWGRIARYFRIIKSSQVTAIYMVDAENRSDKSFNLYKSRVYHYNFRDAISEDEIRYNKKHIILVLRMFLLKKRIKLFFILYKKHVKYISLINVFIKKI